MAIAHVIAKKKPKLTANFARTMAISHVESAYVPMNGQEIIVLVQQLLAPVHQAYAMEEEHVSVENVYVTHHLICIQE